MFDSQYLGMLQELVPECLAAHHNSFMHQHQQQQQQQQQQQHAQTLATGMRAFDTAMIH